MFSVPWFKPTSQKEERGRRQVVEHSLAEEVPYEEIINEYMIYSDGSIGACFPFTPLYVDSMDDMEKYNTEIMLGTMVNALSLGTYMQFVWRKDNHIPIIDSHKLQVQAGDPIVHMMTDDRVRFWKTMAQSQKIFGISSEVWLRRFYPRKMARPFNKMIEQSILPGNIGVSAQKNIVDFVKEHQYIENDFRGRCSQILSPLKNITHVHQASADEMLQSLWRFFVGKSDNPKYSSEKPLRSYFGGWDVTKKWGYLSLGNLEDRLISVMSVDMFPGISYLSMINYLLSIPVPMTLVMNVAPVNMGKAKSFIRKTMRRYETMLFKTDPESEERLIEYTELLRELDGSNNVLFDTEFYIVLEGKTLYELNEWRDTFLTEARSRDFTVNPEKAALELVYKAAMPGACVVGTTDRDVRIKTENVADIAPVLGPMESAAKPVMLMGAPYSGVFGYDLFDPRLPAYHGLIIGATGAGKSFTMNLLLLSSMSQNPQVYIIDKGGSYKKITSLLGGSYVDTSSPDVSFNPLAPKAIWKERMPTICLILQEMVKESSSASVSKLEQIIIERLVHSLFMAFENENREPTLSDAWAYLNANRLYDPDKEKELEVPQRKITLHLSRWTKAGTKGASVLSKYVDNPITSVSLENDMVVFDMLGVQNNPELTNVMFLILSDLIERKVTSNVQRHKMIVFDEAWSVLKSKEGGIFLANLYKTMRKYNCMILSITQSIEDFTDSDAAAAILGQTYQTFILRQNSAAEADIIQDVLKLNDGEKNLVTSLKREKGKYSEAFLRLSGIGSSKMAITPSPVEYWLATTDPSDVQVYNNYLKNGFSPNDAILELSQKYPKGIDNE